MLFIRWTSLYYCDLARLLTAAIEWILTHVFLVKQYSDICPCVFHLSEGQGSHVTPVLEGSLEGFLHSGLLHVWGVVVYAVGEALLAPPTLERRSTHLEFLFVIFFYDCLGLL